jgi:hypothetical protein
MPRHSACGIEFDYRNTLEGSRTELIRGIGPEHCFLSEFWTKNQAPKEYAGAPGVGAFAAETKKRGLTDRELEMMFKDNPPGRLGCRWHLGPWTDFDGSSLDDLGLCRSFCPDRALAANEDPSAGTSRRESVWRAYPVATCVDPARGCQR